MLNDAKVAGAGPARLPFRLTGPASSQTEVFAHGRKLPAPPSELHLQPSGWRTGRLRHGGFFVGASYTLHVMLLWFVPSTHDTSCSAWALPSRMVRALPGLAPAFSVGNQGLLLDEQSRFPACKNPPLNNHGKAMDLWDGSELHQIITLPSPPATHCQPLPTARHIL